MYTINNKKKCTIYNSLLFHDLVDYTIGENATSATIKYSGSSSESNITLKINDITSFIDSNAVTGVWMPAIISDESFVANKPLFDKQNVTNPILGIEYAAQFPASFKNWDIQDTAGNAASAQMITNWYITSIIPTTYAEYGLLFWYKKNAITSSSSYLLTDIPNGSLIKSLSALSYTNTVPSGETLPPTLVDVEASISTSTELIKLDNKTLKITDKTSNLITGSGITFWHELDKFHLDRCSDFNIKTNQFTLVNNAITKDSAEFSLWISDGEAFSYFDSITNKNKYRSRSYASKTYLSPFLMPIYREIYHTLTLRTSRSISTGLTKNQSALLKKLAYFLSTFPLIDRTTVNILNSQTIYNAVQTYINTTPSSKESEITDLKNVLSIIANEYKTSHLTDSFNKINIKNNYINSKSDLVKKLLSKYGAQLYIGTDRALKYKTSLPDGPHALLGLSSVTTAPKGIDSSAVLYNNFKIDIGNISYSTDISTTGSVINISGSGFSQSVTVPLIDISVTKPGITPFTLNNNLYKAFTSPETYFRDINPYSDVDGTYYWEQISGPKCLRFTDYNKDRFRVLRYKTSTDYNPDIYIRQPGTYGLRCTRNSDGIVESDEVYVTTDSNFTGPTSVVPATPTNNKIINSVPRQIGFHKHGLVWFVDTDNYIKDNYTIKATSSFGLLNTFRLKDVKVDIPKPSNFAPSTSGNLKFTFLASAGQTNILVDGLNIERARYKNFDSAQCCSFYNEKIYRNPRSSSLPILGSSNFTRDNGTIYNLSYFDNNGEIYGRTETLRHPDTISTSLAPPILPYGGYDSAKIDAIGITMPSHDAAKPIPILDKRNDIINPPNIYCFLKEVKSNNNSMSILQKGFFDPLQGFKIADDSNLAGKSLVISNKIDKHKSFVFKGNGFFSLKASPDDNALNTYTSNIKLVNNPTPESQQYSKYGYRSYNYDFKSDPNYVVDSSIDSWTSIYDYSYDCGGSTQTTYGFPATGTLDNLYIKDIEIKLNFLNYANPKELIVWLDVTSSSGSSSTIDLMAYRAASNFSSNTDLTNYYNAIDNLNSITTRIYLLNQEHITNYEPNFSVTFSDNASKHNTTSSQNHSIAGQYLGIIPISNNDIIQPTLYATGYNDTDSELYMSDIKKNQINSLKYSLLKFKGMPLKDTVFSLNIGFVNPTEYPSRIMDNLLVNSLILTGSTTEKFAQSNTISNSLCSWEIKINTTNTNKFYSTDVLGKINYSDYIYNGLSSSAVSGYDFIGDFKNNKFLIPVAHINAPHHYLANINQCSYDDLTAGKNWSYMRPTAEENMRTLSLAAIQYVLAGMSVLGGAGVGGAVGALMGVYALQALYERGGRSDPIINFFIETRLLNQTDAQDSQYFKPVYSSKFFGVPDKAIACISQDQNYWYTIEVPIFNMFNSFVVKKQEYNYMKLYSDSVPGISSFEYTTIRNYTDLDLAPVVFTYTSNVSSLSGEVEGFVAGDMVLLSGQTTTSENGYYIISQGNWIKVPSIASPSFLTYNNISNLLTDSSLSGQTHILIDGFRAYHFFDKNETVVLNTLNGNANATISDKSYIQTSTGVKTVLTLNIAVAKNGKIYKDINNANVLWLYKKDLSYSDTQSLNKWLTAKTRNEKAENINPLNFASAYGEGSINSGSDILDPDIFYKLSFKHSELSETNKLLNNENNDKYKFNSVFLTDSSGTITTISFSDSDNSTSLLKGYSSSVGDFLSRPLYDMAINTVDLGEGHRLSNTVFGNDGLNSQFIEIKSDKFKGSGTIPISGSLHIENDFRVVVPTYLSSGDLTNLTNRLSNLCTGIIPGLYTEYYSLKTDPISCYSSYNDTTCPKTAAYQNIKIRETERANIEMALSLSPSSDGFIPYVSGIVSTGSDGGLNINYAINPYLYWIHIDPEQRCDLNDELSVKVLEKIRMRAIPLSEVINEGITQDSASHIVPRTSFVGISSGDHNTSGVSMITQGSVYSYIMGSGTIESSKQQWSTGVIWSGDNKFVYGGLSDSGDSKKLMISRLDSSRDMVVITEETYLKPSGVIQSGKIKDFINFSNGSIYLKFRNIPRKLKSIDSENFERYIYDRNGNLVRSSRPASSVGQIANNFTCWHCVDSSGNFTALPPYYRAANEMRYRAFFGSSDGMENKNSLYLDTKEDWEWIPYEYYSDSNANVTDQATLDFLNSVRTNNTFNADVLRNNYFPSILRSNDTFIQGDDPYEDDMSYTLYNTNYEKYFQIKYRYRIEYYLLTTYYTGDEYDWELRKYVPKFRTETGKKTTSIVIAPNADIAEEKLRQSVRSATEFVRVPTRIKEQISVSTNASIQSTTELPREKTDIRYQYIHKDDDPWKEFDKEELRKTTTSDRMIDFFEHIYIRDISDSTKFNRYPFRITILSSGQYSIYRRLGDQWTAIGDEYFTKSVNLKGIYEAAKAPLIPLYKWMDSEEYRNNEYFRKSIQREIAIIENNWSGGYTLFTKMLYESFGAQIQTYSVPADILDEIFYKGQSDKQHLPFGSYWIIKPAWFEEISFTYDHNIQEPYPSIKSGDLITTSRFSSAREYLWNNTKDLKAIDQKITRVPEGSKLPT